MDFDVVQARVSVLLDPKLTPAAKVLCLVLCTGPNQARLTQLAANSSLGDFEAESVVRGGTYGF